MKYTSKVIYDTERNVPILVYHRPGNKNINGKMKWTEHGNYFERDDGLAHPVLLNANGIWMTVVDAWPGNDNINTMHVLA